MFNRTKTLLFSRSGNSCSFGKCTEEIKTKVPSEIKDEFAKLAHEFRMSESELLRELVIIRTRGLDFARRIYEERLERVAGMGNEKG